MFFAIKIDLNKSIYKFDAGLSKDHFSLILRYTQTQGAFDKN